jgi:hypothetical protein
MYTIRPLCALDIEEHTGRSVNIIDDTVGTTFASSDRPILAVNSFLDHGSTSGSPLRQW